MLRRYNPKSLPYTLCHGDVHSGNLMWRLTRGQYGADPGLLAIDWPDVGIRHGATELAMFFITNPTPDFRRRHEREFMQLYWRTLTEHERVSKEEYPLDVCWDRYLREGQAWQGDERTHPVTTLCTARPGTSRAALSDGSRCSRSSCTCVPPMKMHCLWPLPSGTMTK